MPDCGGHTDVQIDGHVAQTANTAHMHLQAVNSNFCSRPKTHRLATIHSVQTTDYDRRTQHGINSATFSTVG